MKTINALAAAACLACSGFALASDVGLTPVQQGQAIQMPVKARSYFTKNSGCSRLPLVIGQQAGKAGDYADNKMQLDTIACLASKKVTISQAQAGKSMIQIAFQLGFQQPGQEPVFEDRSFQTEFDWVAAAAVPADGMYVIDMPEINVQPAMNQAAKAVKLQLLVRLPADDYAAPALEFRLVNTNPSGANLASGQLVQIQTFERYN